MKKDFDFKEIGKKMPYSVPDRFFDEMENELVKQVVSPQPKLHRFPLKRVMASILSAAAVVGGIAFFLSTEEPEPASVPSAELWMVDAAQQTEIDDWEEYVYQLSDEDLEDWISMDELDVFMEE